MGEWRVRGLLLAFTAAAFVVGVVGGGVLWQAGYRGLVSPRFLLPLAWIVELIVYALVCGGRSGLTVGRAIAVGLFARLAMAAGTAALWGEGAGWPQAFLRSYAQALVGVALQVAMAGVLVWFLADLTPTVRLIEDERPRRRRPSREERARLLEELLPPGEGPEDTGMVRETAKVEASEEKRSVEVAPAAGGTSEPTVAVPSPSPDEEGLEVAETPGIERPEGEVGEREEVVGVEEKGPVDLEAEAGPGEEETEEAHEDVPRPASVFAEEEGEEQETSELAAMRELAGPAPAVVGWALAEAVKNVVPVEGVRPLEPGEGAGLLVVGNAAEGGDDASKSRLALHGAEALGRLATYGLLPAPEFAAGLFRAGGLLVVPGEDALVVLWSAAPANLGLLASQGRKLARSLQGVWPSAKSSGLDLPLPDAEPLPTPEAVARATQALGHPCEAFRVAGVGALGVLASAGCDCQQAAAAAAALWSAWSDLGRVEAHGGLRRLVVPCGQGAIALGLAQREGGETFLFVRLAPQAQPGLAVAEIERLAQEYLGE